MFIDRRRAVILKLVGLTVAVAGTHPRIFFAQVEGLNRAFPNVGKGELFLWVSRHWHYMKKGGTVEVPVQDAVLDFGVRFAHDAITRFGFFLKRVAA